jgi:monoamine oxidase
MAAAELHAAGFDVVLLEARDRAGGRVWSRLLRDGLVVELGAELIEDWYTTLLGLATRYGLTLVPGPERLRRFPFFVGGALAAVESEDILARVEEALAELSRLVAHQSPTVSDAMTVREGLNLVRLDGVARQWFEALISGWSCRETDEESLLAFVETRARPLLRDDPKRRRWARRLAGGNDQIARRLIEPLGDRVYFKHAVRALSLSNEGVTVRAETVDGDGGAFAVDAAVCALPYSVLQRIQVTPVLPDETRAAIARVDAGLGAKAVIRYDGPYAPPDLFLSQSPRFHAWRSGDRPAANSLTLYFGGDATRSLEAIDVELRHHEVVRRLSISHPEIAAAVSEVHVQVWSEDRLTETCGPVYRPGAFLGHEERPSQPFERRLYFAGEQTSIDAFGSMEGALRTGRRAADQVKCDWS